MPDKTPENPVGPPASVHIQVDRELLNYLDQLRLVIQTDLNSPLVVSRGDVVRLALRRLVLAYLVHCSEANPDDLVSQDKWDHMVAMIHYDATCPDWLLPGRPATPRPAQKTGRRPTIKEDREK